MVFWWFYMYLENILYIPLCVCMHACLGQEAQALVVTVQVAKDKAFL